VPPLSQLHINSIATLDHPCLLAHSAENNVTCATELVAYSDDIAGAVFSLGHVFRGNSVAGGVSLALNFAWDTVVDRNTFAAAFCWFANATLPAGGVLFNSSSPGTQVAYAAPASTDSL
jgi:hypothetical protein